MSEIERGKLSDIVEESGQMTRGTANAVIAGAAWGISLAAAALSFTEFDRSIAPWLKAAALGALALVAAAITVYLVRRAGGHDQAALKYLDMIAGLDGWLRGGDVPAAPRPNLPAGHSALGVVERVTGLLAKLAERLTDLEQQQATLEVRARKHAAQYDQVKTILTGLSEPVLVVDQYNELLLANSSAGRLLKLDPQSAEHQALTNIVRCEQLVALLDDTRQRRTAAPRTTEIELADGSGEARCFSVTATPLIDTQPALGQREASRGAVAVLRDVTAQRATQKRHAEFVSAVSHEMKTPLAGIKAYVELLVDGDAEDEATREEFLGIIQGQADRLQRLIDNMLNIARIEAGVVKVSKQPLALNDVLQDAVRVVQPSAEAKQQHLAAELSPLYLGVLVDRDMLLQAAINLLSNAVKYTPPGGRITVRSQAADHEARFEVEDTGVGLSPEDAVKVFEKFYRVEKDKTMAAGTGLGLPLAKHIVEDVHGGRLTVESAVGVGSKFVVTLPGAGQIQ